MLHEILLFIFYCRFLLLIRFVSTFCYHVLLNYCISKKQTKNPFCKNKTNLNL